MSGRITLPRLLGFRLIGFQPIFRSDVSMSIGKGPNIILGGNGLGKTTIMQAIIYGLAGGLSESIEENRSLRWHHGYFRGRLSANQVRSAAVEVDFAFGKTDISVRRGFSGSDVIAFRTGHKQRWITEPNEAKSAFKNALRQYGGYNSPDDFSFIVHRLLYLPETRRLLAWDTNAQIRILMLLNKDVSTEEEFRKRREQLRLMDTRKRHIHVALGKAEQAITSLMQYDDQSIDETQEEDSPSLTPGNGENLSNLVNQLQQIAKQRTALEKEAQDVAHRLSAISDEVESLREKIEQSEAALVATFLSEQERESVLALHKMAENGICPVCGTRQSGLQALAHRHAQLHQCLLCGSEEPEETNPELSTLRSQLAERIKSQQIFTHELRTINNKIESIRPREEQIQTLVNKIRFAQPVVQLLERDLPATTQEDLIQLKKSLEQQEADLEAQIIVRRSGLERDYSNFKKEVYNRIEELDRKYEIYASQFLGLHCELSERPDEGLITLSRFVPKFNETVRETPESCSEAQRFFLDIAFRMALIDLATEYEHQPGMFICETPETALDMSYIDNVVKMFEQFSDKGHTLLLSANIQSNGIASKLLKTVPAKKRSSHVLNLLDYGQLSDVHKAALPKLRSEVRRAMK